MPHKNPETRRQYRRKQYLSSAIVKEKKRQYYLKNRDKILAQTKARHANKSSHHRRTIVLLKYGLTPEDFSAMIGEQMNLCACCKRPMVMKARQHDSCQVDHDHKTGKVRGLLCLGCNTGLGNFEDNPMFLELAAGYLRKHT